MKIEPLSLEHQSLLEPAWKKLCSDYHICFSEYSFANAYLFRKKHHYALANCETPCLQGQFKDGNYFLVPSTSPREIKLKLSHCPEGKIYCFYPLLESWVPDFESMNMHVTTSPADSDYIYHVSKLATLSGRELSSRRNLLHQLQNNHKVESFPLDINNLKLAYEILEQWQSQSSLSKEETDYFSCIEALELMDKLKLFGRLALANGKPVGFSIGELLTRKTALMHFAKSLKEYKGVTPFLYQDFATHLPKEIEWINLEQDLGIPALRQAKKAYAPDKLLNKWKACE